MSRLSWSTDPEMFRRWSTGTTGMPLVDANMRELAQTGRGGWVLWAAGLVAAEQLNCITSDPVETSPDGCASAWP